MTPEIVMRYWTLVAPSGEIAICELVRGASGFEVQCTVAGSERVLRASGVKTQHDGFNLSEEWRSSYAAKGWQTHPDAT
jgi:hypothetical protein